MKIITGLRPKAEVQRLPEHTRDISFYREEVSPVVPVPSLKTREVWILTFQKVTYFDGSEVVLGEVMETMLSATEPKVEKRGFHYGITDEHRAKDAVDARYRRQYNAPDDAQKEVRHYGPTQQTDVTYSWYEVTL